MQSSLSRSIEPKRLVVNSKEDWRAILADAATNVEALHREFRLGEPTPRQVEAARQYSAFVPRPYLDRIEVGCPRDPLLMQILPHDGEVGQVEGFDHDPVGEVAATRSLGLLHKFAGRALIVTTPACSVHCRFCFRRHLLPLWGGAISCSWQDWEREIQLDKGVSEVIFSGGDPLILPDEELAEGLDLLGRIPHVRRLRIHSRLPITIPQRVTDSLLDVLRGAPRTVFLVVHVNHRREIDEAVAAGFQRLRQAGIPVLSQSVLLRGVNDSVESLAELFEALADRGVIPYYLHQLDRVAGAAHFEVPEPDGRTLVRRLRELLPGYAVPRYVRERAGAAFKEPLE